MQFICIALLRSDAMQGGETRMITTNLSSQLD